MRSNGMRLGRALAIAMAVLVAVAVTPFDAVVSAADPREVVIDFEDVSIYLDPDNDEIIHRVEQFESKGVTFTLATPPQRSKAKGRLMFFPHISSGRKGILNAMAEEQEIPVRARFPKGASRVAITFWGSTGTPAKLQAFDQKGTVVATDELRRVPGRSAPEDPIPTFTLSVQAPEIAWIEFSGPRSGEYLAADELRWIPLP